MKIKLKSRHPRESGDPGLKPFFKGKFKNWIPAFAGMTLAIALLNLAWAIPTTMRFQGRLTDSQGRPITGTPQVRFEIFNAASGGASVWGPSPYLSVNSNDAGLFSVDIDVGPTGGTVFSSVGDLYLQVTVKAGTGGQDQVLSPRQHLSSVPYAFFSQVASSATTAGTANSVSDNSISTSKIQDDAVTSSKILDRSILSVDIATKTVSSSNIADQGVRGINIEDGTITPAKMDVPSFTSAGWIVPQGAVFLFLGTSCPAGYTEVVEFRNRFVVGADLAGTDPLIPDSPGNTIANTLNHNHNVSANVSYGSEVQAFDDRSDWAYLPSGPAAATAVIGSPVSGAGIRGRPFTVSATTANQTLMPPGYTTIFCRKQ